MPTTITLTEEAQAFFARNPDPALRALVDLGLKEYGEFMGGLPLVVDAFTEEDVEHTRVVLVVEISIDHAEEVRSRRNGFVREWYARHAPEVRRKLGFSVRYR